MKAQKRFQKGLSFVFLVLISNASLVGCGQQPGDAGAAIGASSTTPTGNLGSCMIAGRGVCIDYSSQMLAANPYGSTPYGSSYGTSPYGSPYGGYGNYGGAPSSTTSDMTMSNLQRQCQTMGGVYNTMAPCDRAGAIGECVSDLPQLTQRMVLKAPYTIERGRSECYQARGRFTNL